MIFQLTADGLLQVRAGDAAVTSARAVDEATMKMLYCYNVAFPRLFEAFTKKRKADHPEEWAGFIVRMMLQVLYITSMLCLLRYDEALRIMWTDISLEVAEDGQYRVCLRLPFRKTHQNGGTCFSYAQT